MELTHASFFSGVGGLDLGLERAGWRTVSFSEIDPYASAVLAQRWRRVPNLGDITRIADGVRSDGGSTRASGTIDRDNTPAEDREWSRDRLVASGAAAATLWSGGFPCQDLSVAGKRRGLAGERSGLAFAFLDLVERHRPPAILLENVPGLLSSHRGRDFYALQRRMAELGYVGAYRVLDAQFFGVPQRRRRVFIVALDAQRGFGADSAAEVLSVGSRCAGHPAPGVEAGPGAAERARGGVDIARAVVGTAWKRHDEDIDTLIAFDPTAGRDDRMYSDGTSPGLKVGSGVGIGWAPAVLSPSPDAGGVRAADGLAGRLDDRGGVADGIAETLNSGGNSGGFRTEPGAHLVATLRVGPATIRDGGPGDTVPLTVSGGVSDPSPILPLGLDSHRYRCCGNGVVSSVAEWIGLRLAEALA